MTDKNMYKMISDRAKEIAKDKKIIDLARQKFGTDFNAMRDYVYKLAIATLYGAVEGGVK